MNRELKFRVWNNYSKRFESKGFLTTWCNEKSKNYTLSGIMEYEQSDEEYGDDGEDVEILQFTGLKDKNGVEIYDGDILKNSFGDIIKVEFNCGSYGNFDISTSIWLSFCSCYTDYDELEVIGNIYENSNLLNK